MPGNRFDFSKLKFNYRPLCIAGASFPREIVDGLKKLCETVVLPTDPGLPENLSGHADLSLLVCGSKIILREAYYIRNRTLLDGIAVRTGKTILTVSGEAGKIYPGDCGLCIKPAFPVGQYCTGSENCGSVDIVEEAAVRKKPFVICNPSTALPGALSAALTEGCEQISVKQGYSACSVAVLSDGACITSDKGIARRLSEHSIDHLLISPGNIRLPGYTSDGEELQGFIGGATGLMGDLLVFAGSHESHPDAKLIEAFCEAHSTGIIDLGPGQLFDGGGLLFI